jgi:iron complex outermembrane receptor protein
MPPFLSSLTILLVVCLAADVFADDTKAKQPQDLKKLSLEELSQIEVTSVSRRPESLSRTPAAISVIRGEDARRSGYTSLAEVLRLGDAIDVAQVNGGTWGISTRGFNLNTANKLLVLVDGRSTYVPLFGGTFWDTQDMFLGDLDRIEVIRGPGGTLWGANAVNGVVNIITKSAAETQGTLVHLAGGTSGMAVAAARYGGRVGPHSYRVYGKFRHRGEQLLSTGAGAEDPFAFGQAGFRVDSNESHSTRWFLSGLLYRSTTGLTNRLEGEDEAVASGGHLLANLRRPTPGQGAFELQAYYDRSDRTVPLQFDGDRNTGELDLQQSLKTGRHQLTFGSTWRFSDARDTGVSGFLFEPEERTSWTINAFVQDEYELVTNRAYITAGSKFGRNNYTGLELQPNVRVRLQDGDRQMLWGAVSRALRLPTRFDTDLRLVNPINGRVLLTGSEDFETESVVAYEAGYRAMPIARLSVDVAVFTNRYDSLRSQEFRPGLGAVELDNLLNATTNGVELALAAAPIERWRLRGGYTWFRSSLSFDPESNDPTGGRSESQDPAHQLSLRSWLDLPRNVSVDTMLRYVSRRPGPSRISPGVPAYGELDVRVGWMANDTLELSLLGQNLLHKSHGEMLYGGPPEEFRRAVMLRSLWRF